MHRHKQCWSVFLKLKIALKLRCFAKLSALRKESDGESEDARRPLENLPTTSKTFKAIYTC
eukprot:13640095-Heterocapsa_arctica.AAC.1